MARLKLNLPSGLNVEKPVITCFNVESNTYLILDAENIGSMGLPIILVCKVENGTVKKITDATEWQKAKDYLKGIIAGNSMSYISVGSEMSADEVYYTQLTLPVASFDIIKNAYTVKEESIPVVDDSVIDSAVSVSDMSNGVADIPVVDVVMPENPVPTEPIIPEAPVVEPVIPEIPAVQESAEDVDFSETKEAFMKACENMFDALVAKFKAELDSKK